jgi:hypothetical protein
MQSKIKHTKQSSGGTSFHQTTISTSVGVLKRLFPDSFIEVNTGYDKCNYDFTLENSDGDVFTIYDWKEYRPISDKEIIEFHIGGKSQAITEKAKEELLEILETIK